MWYTHVLRAIETGQIFVPSVRKLPNTRYCCINLEFFPNPNISNIRQLAILTNEILPVPSLPLFPVLFLLLLLAMVLTMGLAGALSAQGSCCSEVCVCVVMLWWLVLSADTKIIN